VAHDTNRESENAREPVTNDRTAVTGPMACAIALYSRSFIERFSLLLAKQGNRFYREAATR
jgi:hypothetical protein